MRLGDEIGWELCECHGVGDGTIGSVFDYPDIFLNEEQYMRII